MAPLSGARVWLTGASAGIGEAMVGPLIDAGARVALTARREDALARIAGRHPAGATLVVPADVTDRTAVHRAAARISEAWGGIDLAIFNAGGEVLGAPGAAGAAAFVDNIRLNYFSVVYGVEAVVPSMLARGSGHIAAMGSVAAYGAVPTAAGYGAAKAALNYAMDALRFDLEPRGVAVTIINPGFVRTSLSDRLSFYKPFLMTPDRAARIIVDGLARRRREIHFPRAFSWVLKGLRLLPRPIYLRMVDLATRQARRERNRARQAT
jgi:NADP-dependent 3-hydroxy acid dehydrogenase YdfG